MACGSEINEKIDNHPCYSEKAHHFFARMHLPVAPACNIQCNYCNRKYDCANESRPGVVSERLKPEEALQKVYYAAENLKQLSVIGIAGPGDALANPKRTFKTMSLIHEKFPDLKLCLSTNGLALPDHVDEIVRLGIDHVTVTVNTFNAATAQKIYKWVIIDKKKKDSLEDMEYFLQRQQEGIRKLATKGVLVKVNSLLIPGLNDQELPTISKKLKLMGAFMHNIMPLISKPEHGTEFGLQNWPEPHPKELEIVRESCGDLKQMAHCRQCRADAVGLLGQDKFGEYEKNKLQVNQLPNDNGLEKRQQWKEEVNEMRKKMPTQKVKLPHQQNIKLTGKDDYLIAVCTKGQGVVNEHFGHAKEFYIYRIKDGVPGLINVRKVPDHYCDGDETCGDKKAALENILNTIGDCNAVVTAMVGYTPHRELEKRGVLPVTDVAYMKIEEAVKIAAEKLASGIKPKSAFDEDEAVNSDS
ncbi:MAG: nitrogenase cofactor biosynthesis protein NifB [Nitrospinae bacterium]|nr:nitrogenase cofactor biosynthesis protein NifB [Nitrospinota bacterium]